MHSTLLSTRIRLRTPYWLVRVGVHPCCAAFVQVNGRTPDRGVFAGFVCWTEHCAARVRCLGVVGVVGSGIEGVLGLCAAHATCHERGERENWRDESGDDEDRVDGNDE